MYSLFRSRPTHRLMSVFVGMVLAGSCMCYAQNANQKRDVTESVQEWQKARNVEIPDAARKEAVQKLGAISAEIRSRTTQYELSDADYKKAVSAAIFVVLDRALRAKIQEHPGEVQMRPETLDLKSLKDAGTESIPAFWNSSDGYGFLTLESNPSKAEIYVDGEFQGYTKTRLGLSVGHHTYEVRILRGPHPRDCKGELNVQKKRVYERTCQAETP